MSLECFTVSDSPETMLAALRRDGAIILRRAIEPSLAAVVAGELRPWFDREGRQTESDFNGYSTLRVGSIVARSPSVPPLIAHPALLALADAILLPNCLNYQIGSTTGVEILPGESDQRLHRDVNCYAKRIPGIEFQISALWSLQDFTLENGATRVVLGSHRWEAGRQPGPADSVVQAAMPAGSLLIYLGSTLHGGGANLSDTPRMGLVNTYCLGWLRQEENQYLSVPRAIADRLPDRVRRLLGYQRHGLIGWFPDDPDDRELAGSDDPRNRPVTL